MAYWLEKVPHCVSEPRGIGEPLEGAIMVSVYSYREEKETG